MHTLILVGSVPVVALTTALLNWLALIPWRRHREEHWAEQARRLAPVRATAQLMQWMLPLVLVLTAKLTLPHASWGFLVGLGATACVGVAIGSMPLSRELFPRTTLAELARQTVLGLCLQFLLWFVLIVAIMAMPEEFGWRSLGIGAAVVALQLYWARSGWLRIGRRIGLFAPAPARLRRIVDEMSAKTGIVCRNVWVMRTGACQAFALPITKEMLFSDHLLEVMPDEEIAAICAHELAHLTEPRPILFLRIVSSMTYLPWIFLIPLMHTLGFVGLYVPLAVTVLIPWATAKLCQRLEARADKLAAAQEDDSGAYARALLRLSESNLAPMVLPGKHATHPHTYDRLVAAGVTPDFPRPRAPATMGWHGFLLSGILGAEIAILAIQYLR